MIYFPKLILELFKTKFQRNSYQQIIFIFVVIPLFCFNLNAQVKIKERVGITPAGQNLNVKTTADYPPLEFQIGGPKPFIVTVNTPSGSTTLSGGGAMNPNVYCSFPAVNGIYGFRVSADVEPYSSTHVEVTISWGSSGGIFDEVKYLLNGTETIANIFSTITYTFSGISEPPPPPALDFSIALNRNMICGIQESGMNIVFSVDTSSLGSKNIQLLLEDAGVDAILFDNFQNISLGKSTTTTINKVNNLVIKLNTPYTGLSRSMNVTAYSNGLTRTAALTIDPANNEVFLQSDSDGSHIISGRSKKINIDAMPANECSTYLNDAVKYNLEIISGIQTGQLKNPVNGVVGSVLNNLDHVKGKLTFLYEANGRTPVDEDTVVVRATTTDANVASIDITLYVNRQKIDVTFMPASIKAKDTSNVVIKMRDSTGVLVDFPANQIFGLEITDGIDYGDLFFRSRFFWLKAKKVQSAFAPFKYIAADLLPASTGEATVVVSAVKDGKTLWGDGKIKFGTPTVFIKAYFDKQNLSPGDTANVYIKKVDENGVETNFADTTHFEVGIKEGCSIGEILTADSRKGLYFYGLQKPIRFVVKDSLAAADTNIVLRIGVPPNRDTTYVPFGTTLSKVTTDFMSKIGNISLSVKESGNNTVLLETTLCDTTVPLLADYGEARGEIDKTKIKITITGDKYIWPTLTNGSGGNPGKRNIKEFIIVSVTNRNKPVVNFEIKLTASIIFATGGHKHVQQPSIALLGEFKEMMTGNSAIGKIKTWTNSKGEIVLSYTAPEFSGKIELIAKSALNDAIDKDTLLVRIPDLIMFEGNGDYKLTGSNDVHQKNHFFANQHAINDLIEAANLFSKQDWNTTGNMKLNDMSLEWGGLFDLDESWTNGKGHNSHRIGKSVDIENLKFEQIDTTDQKTGRRVILNIPKVSWVRNFQRLMETTLKKWDFEDEWQTRNNVFKRTKKYPHFEWKGN